MAWKNVLIMFAVMLFIGFMIKALHWTYVQIEQSGYDRYAAENATANKLFQEKLNDENKTRMAVAVKAAIEQEKEAIQFSEEVRNEKPTITESEINSAIFDRDFIGGDFGRLFNNAIGVPIYGSDSEVSGVIGPSN